MINKFQQGGVAQGGILQQIALLPKELQQQIMQAFAKWAQAKGIDINQLQENESALEQAMTTFIQEMQNQSQAARLGAKINYIRQLKGGCPEGEELVYFKRGGKVCKECIKSEKCGGKAKKSGKDTIKEFKTKKACGGLKAKFSTGGQTPEKNKQLDKKEENKTKVIPLPYKKGEDKAKVTPLPHKKGKETKKYLPANTKSLPGGKYPSYWTADLKIEWENLHGPHDEGAHVAREEKCGGKMKKHLLGGIIGL